MRIQITAGGIYNAKGEELPVGTEIELKKEPTAWSGRYNVLKGAGDSKTAVTNPKKEEDPAKAELENLSVADLKALAEREKIDLKGATAKGDMIAHILTSRAKG